MAELDNKLSATPLNPATPTPHTPQNLSGRVPIAAASQRSAESVSEKNTAICSLSRCLFHTVIRVLWRGRNGEKEEHEMFWLPSWLFLPVPQGLELTEILRLKNTLLYTQRGRKQHVCPAFVPPKCLCAKARRGTLGWRQGSIQRGGRSEFHLVSCVTPGVTLDWCSLHPEL